MLVEGRKEELILFISAFPLYGDLRDDYREFNVDLGLRIS